MNETRWVCMDIEQFEIRMICMLLSWCNSSSWPYIKHKDSTNLPRVHRR